MGRLVSMKIRWGSGKNPAVLINYPVLSDKRPADVGPHRAVCNANPVI
jgi:hypothetical protein